MVSRVTTRGIVGVILVSAVAGSVWGRAGVVGTAGAGLIALANFRWLARGTLLAGRGEGRHREAIALGLRHLGTVVALGALVASGWVHPIAVVLGVVILPPLLIAQGLSRGDG